MGLNDKYPTEDGRHFIFEAHEGTITPEYPEQPVLDFVAYSGMPTRNNTQYSVEGMDIGDYLKNPIVQLGHNLESLPIGRSLATWKAGEMLRASIEFAPDEHSQSIYRLYREGFMRGISIGGFPTASTEDRVLEDGRTIRYYPRSKLIQLALVPIPGDGDALSIMEKLFEKHPTAPPIDPTREGLDWLLKSIRRGE